MSPRLRYEIVVTDVAEAAVAEGHYSAEEARRPLLLGAYALLSAARAAFPSVARAEAERRGLVLDPRHPSDPDRGPRWLPEPLRLLRRQDGAAGQRRPPALAQVRVKRIPDPPPFRADPPRGVPTR